MNVHKHVFGRSSSHIKSGLWSIAALTLVACGGGDGDVQYRVSRIDYESVSEDGYAVLYRYESGQLKAFDVVQQDGSVSEGATYEYVDGLLTTAKMYGSIVHFAYDAQGRVSNISSDNNGDDVIDFTRTLVLDAHGVVVEYTFDMNGDGTADGTVSYVNVYDAEGRLSSREGNGSLSTYQYDERGLRTTKTSYDMDGAQEARYTYTWEEGAGQSPLMFME